MSDEASTVHLLNGTYQLLLFPDNEMRNITSRFSVGFGTMVDKPVAPYSISSEK